jgi:hypothetical protein
MITIKRSQIMGEAKRRRLLDPNYGQAKVPDELEQIFDSFVNKQIDIAIISNNYLSQPYSEKFGYKKPTDTGFSTHQHTTVAVSPSDNFARQIFLEYQQSIMASITPLIQQRGSGWISQINNPKTCDISIAYIPDNTENLRCLERQVFTRTLGKMVSGVMKSALKKWSFQPDNILIPVVAISSNNDKPSYLFCL